MSAVVSNATLHIVGLGPGDPQLMTLKAARVVQGAPAVAFFAKANRQGIARAIVDGWLSHRCEELRFEYPYTTEIHVDEPQYVNHMENFYDQSAASIAARLDQGKDVALLCEGDPFFYGSAMYMFDRLAARYLTQVIPGVTGFSGCAASARAPLSHGDDVLCVLPGTLDEATLCSRLQASDAVVLMKIGRNLSKVRRAIEAAGSLDRALYIERGTHSDERVTTLAEVTADCAPYFSLIIIPGRRNRR
jgi:precorrin-2/cobalt-factor-2 C20-methyltransferase